MGVRDASGTQKIRDADVCTWSEEDKAQQRRQSSCDCHVGFASFAVPVNYTRFMLGTAGEVSPSVLLPHGLLWLRSFHDFIPRLFVLSFLSKMTQGRPWRFLSWCVQAREFSFFHLKPKGLTKEGEKINQHLFPLNGLRAPVFFTLQGLLETDDGSVQIPGQSLEQPGLAKGVTDRGLELDEL